LNLRFYELGGLNINTQSQSDFRQSVTVKEVQAALDFAARNGVFHNAKVTLLKREKNIQESTFPSEVVTCRTECGHNFKLMFKYYSERGNEAFGHRGGVKYEADVYQYLLGDCPATLPQHYGIYKEKSGDYASLILEFLDKSVRVNKSSDPMAMRKAARWVGEFHMLNQTRINDPKLDFLKKYNAEYYFGWSKRTMHYARKVNRAPSWLRQVCDRFDQVVELLTSAEQTIIHGEYSPKNILIYGGKIYPVDWESAAIAPGEIDLALLTDQWPEDSKRALENEYLVARWPDEKNNGFDKMMCASRIYVQLRWLGNHPEETASDTCRFQMLHFASEEFGLL
jgi:Phosphotransferase enzyme family